jgi:LruC domain-containing protein
MKISIKIFVAIVLGIINYNVNAQTVSTDCENYRSGNTPSTTENIACDRANCWGFGAFGYTNTSGQIISGSYSARSNSMSSSDPKLSAWIKTPWLKPGSGNVTLKVKMENTGGTGTTLYSGNYKAVRIRIITYNSSATYGEGSFLSDSFTYLIASPYTNTQTVSFQIPSAIANSNNPYKFMMSFIGSGGNNRANIDEIVIPGTYWSNPSNGCLPQALIVDTDSDGVQDSDDAYPNDILRAYNNYYPEKGNGTLMFEDLWPTLGDYDFNDLVVGYRFNRVTNSDNNIVEIKYEVTPRAIGASYNNGFGFMLNNITSDKIYSVEGLKNGAEWLNNSSNGTEADQKTATIIVFTNANAIMGNPGGTSGVNVDPKGDYTKPTTISFSVKLMDESGKAPNGVVSLKEFTPADFNPFIVINQERGNELHLPGYAPSEKVNTKIFGTEQDNSKEGNYYKSKSNLPWGLNVPEEIPYAIEKTDFIKAYLNFAEWAQTNGKNYSDWYENKEKYRNYEVIYETK